MISIVTAYYNRKKLFQETLKSIARSKFKDFELIAVDDGSLPEHRIEDLSFEFPFLRVIRLEPENKWYINPCVPFNIGMREAKGDIIVLQNPECLHVHDVLTYMSKNVNDSNYITISTYGFNQVLTDSIPRHCANGTLVYLLNSQPQQPYVGWDSIGWYNHPRFRPVYYHFCSAMTRNNMAKLKGFDEKFAHGIGFDDDELLVRIVLLGLRPIIETSVSVIHQYHDTVAWNKPNVNELTERNRKILLSVTRRKFTYDIDQKNLWNGI